MNLNPESSPQIPDDSACRQAGAAESLSLWGYFVKCWKLSAKYGGRARRKEFWGFCLFALIFLLALFFINIVVTAKVNFTLFLYVNLLFIIAMCLPFMAVTVRRLHDIGKSGWWGLPFTLFPITFFLSGLILALVIVAAGDGAAVATAVEKAIILTAFAHVLAGPFISIWWLSWLCRGSEWSSNKYGECPLDVDAKEPC